jgi:hypothetical protein
MLFHVGIAVDDTDGKRKTNGHQGGNKIIEISWLSSHMSSQH